MAWAHVVNDRASDSAGAAVASLALAYTSNVTSGDLLVAVCTANGGATVSSVTDSQANTWTLVSASPQPNSVVACAIYATIAGSTGACTVTMHPSASAACAIALGEFSGVQKAADGTGKNTAVSSVTTSASTTAANELVIGGYGDNGDGTTVRANSASGQAITTGGNNSPTGNTTAVLTYGDSGASGATKSAAWTGASTGSDSVNVVVIKLSAGGAAVQHYSFLSLLGVG